ncbi:MAG: tRNA (adenosine(37)-N6)-threonylcarbamoyltransferase complex dimerization subunit type 1 TsaB [Alkalispirochaeta sp.]
MTRILAIDTAGPVLGLALIHDGELQHTSDNSGPLRHVEQIVPRIDEALSYAGWNIRDLTAVAISAGPGSFTGLRVGMSAAKALALSGGIPVISIDTLMALAATERYRRGAEPDPERPTVIVPVLDARKSRFYAAAFRNTAELARLAEDGDLTWEELELMMRSVLPGDDSRWCAPGSMTELFQEYRGYVAAAAHKVSAAPGAALLGYRRLGTGAADSAYQGPFYLRSGDVGRGSSIPRFKPAQESD